MGDGSRHVIGFIVGVLQGQGSTIASFMSMAGEEASKHPESFGKGAIRRSRTGPRPRQCLLFGEMFLFSASEFQARDRGVMLGALMLYGLNQGPCC